MLTNRPRVVALVCPGSYQDYLVERLFDDCDLLGVVVQITNQAQTKTQHESQQGQAGKRATQTHRAWVKRAQPYLNPAVLIRYLQAKIFLPAFERAAHDFIVESRPTFYTSKVGREHVEVLETDNINHDEVVTFIQRLSPDLVCVNGTQLLRASVLKVLEALPLGGINLHTGLSPYARGGNCNLFMMLQGKPEFIGATVHYLDPGIDSGKILCTIRPDIDLKDNFEILDAKTFLAGIDAILEVVIALANKTLTPVEQWTEGQLFLKRTGYEYSPYMRLKANRMSRAGVIDLYVRSKQYRDSKVRLVSLKTELDG